MSPEYRVILENVTLRLQSLITGTVWNGTKLRGIVVRRAACLPAKSAKFPIKRHLAQSLRRSNMLNLVALLIPTQIFFDASCKECFRYKGFIVDISSRAGV